MLIVVPPSESKRPGPDLGEPVALDRLSFPGLTDQRSQVLEALRETSARPDAFRRLSVTPARAADVARNIRLRELPAMPVLDRYDGPLHIGLAASSLSTSGAIRAAGTLVVTSPLWGVLRPADRIPPYRLHVCAHLVGMDRLEPFWREMLGDVLADAAGPQGLILDLRSPSYQAMGMPSGAGDRTITLRVDRHGRDGRRIGDVVAKRVRGQAARHILETGADPDEPAELAELFAERWPARLEEPDRTGRSWTLRLTADD